jgi:hypothetical protein
VSSTRTRGWRSCLTNEKRGAGAGDDDQRDREDLPGAEDFIEDSPSDDPAHDRLEADQRPEGPGWQPAQRKAAVRLVPLQLSEEHITALVDADFLATDQTNDRDAIAETVLAALGDPPPRKAAVRFTLHAWPLHRPQARLLAAEAQFSRMCAASLWALLKSASAY